MPSTFTSRLRLERPATGEQSGLWGNTANQAVFDLIDEATYSVSSIAVPDINLVLAVPNGVPSPNRAFTYSFTGSLTATRTITLPSIERRFEIENATNGSLTFIVAGKTGSVTIPPSGFRVLISGLTTLRETLTFLPDGTQANPAVGFSLDPNTGIYRPGADIFGITTGGLGRATFSSGLTQFNTDALAVLGSQAALELRKSAVGQSSRLIGSVSGLGRRWLMELGNSVAETGANVGSDLTLFRYSDAGVSLGQSFSMSRATGNASFTNALSVAGNASFTNALSVGGRLAANIIDGREILLNNPAGDARIEVGSSGVSYIDLKTPEGDDFDLRISASATNSILVAATSLSIQAVAGAINYSAAFGGHNFNGQVLYAGQYLFNESKNDTGFFTNGDGSIGVKTNNVGRSYWLNSGTFFHVADFDIQGVGDASFSLNFVAPSYGRVGTIVAVHAPGLAVDIDIFVAGQPFIHRNSGQAFAPAGWFTGSDARVKSSIQPILNPMAKIALISGKTFIRDDLPAYDGTPGPRLAGVIAQEVEAALPEAVSRSIAMPASYQTGGDTSDFRCVDPVALIALLIECVKELNARVATLEAP